ncbi:undecaprenyl-phosphate glucose phosphotransferase [Ferruginivarius sediminum]|uniref:undecaprenyl-phosphate glucose phosphotransferase n=1 Tax=Ferruginivarius sediminum TaxID=2661937 RepID=UPI0013799E33|nr:undecaprenyl-phosphate glucose phosphotransferase [Ferruginivarius sediminum]
MSTRQAVYPKSGTVQQQAIRSSRSVLYRTVVAGDLLVLLAFAVLGEWARWQVRPDLGLAFVPVIVTVLAASCIFVLLASGEARLVERPRAARRAAVNWTLAFAAVSPLAYVMKGDVAEATLDMASWYALSLAGLVGWRTLVSEALLRVPRFRSRLAERVALVVYDDAERAVDWIARVEGATRGNARVVALAAPGHDATVPGVAQAETIGDLVMRCDEYGVDRILVAAPDIPGRELAHRLQPLRCCAVEVDAVANGYDPDIARWPAVSFAGIPAVRLVTRPLSDTQVFVKRVEDIVLSCLALLFLAPVMLAIAAVVKLGSPGPVLFRQNRHGFNHACFKVWKFRTMYVDTSGSKDVPQARQNDPRVTRIGRFLRRTSLDELPQLFNVLLGEMSIVGPRPHAVEHNEFYGPLIENYMARHRVKPGITGWAQVHGWRGETAYLEKMKARIDYDVWYVDNWSVILDLKIIVMTFSVLWHPNAY